MTNPDARHCFFFSSAAFFFFFTTQPHSQKQDPQKEQEVASKSINKDQVTPKSPLQFAKEVITPP
jgi:hypothetical protein